ncbi:MAG TPA: nuclear transport factor 2 family protein [Alphaproteobacteria bacterium]|jgi:ketosteroid isomerase-like protein|nr:nuclear transport factor 2 family protein [Alphaproteobacteria bacterium]MDP6269968.1 nuclear transport factor 2 family protein [Alphaproteobacteria bacterium]HJM50399.1 nuclear transport factor 2 family protein [Alphaproteobacteria bacterium]|tara:strand:+ start:355 stop:825 length:471 start_codon:yes stop_codon:yes gene_type:complete
MDFSDQIREFCAAVEAGDGGRLAALFTEDGVYDDLFYGAFAGRPAIAAMYHDLWCRDGERFCWEMEDVVADGRLGYARYYFSYTSKMAATPGRRVYFEGVACFRLQGGLIERYEEVVRTGECLTNLGLEPEKLLRVAAKWSERQNAGERALRHLAL